MVKKQSIMHFQFGNVGDFLRIVVASPPMVPTCRRLLEQGMPVMGGAQHSFETYESNWAYTLRYMVDREITGCSWATLKAGAWRQRPWTTASGAHLERKSHCQLEMDVRFSDLVSHAPEGEFMAIAPLRILSFDIECAGRPGIFPEAHELLLSVPVSCWRRHSSLAHQPSPPGTNSPSPWLRCTLGMGGSAAQGPMGGRLRCS